MRTNHPLHALAAILIVTAPFAVRADAPAPDAATAKYEVRFMEGMADHHAMAVMMGEMCLEEAVHTELLTTCENIATTQTAEIELLQAWLSDWYGIEYMPEMKETGHMKHMASMDPAEFEQHFMEMMIRHHEGAIREASQCVERAYHEDLVELCEEIIAAQTAEIEQMETWLCEWYGDCR